MAYLTIRADDATPLASLFRAGIPARAVTTTANPTPNSESLSYGTPSALADDVISDLMNARAKIHALLEQRQLPGYASLLRRVTEAYDEAESLAAGMTRKQNV